MSTHTLNAYASSWLTLLLILALNICASSCFASQNWATIKEWQTASDKNCYIEIIQEQEEKHNFLKTKYALTSTGGWVTMIKQISNTPFTRNTPISFLIKADSKDFLEIKFIDKDGTVFGRKTTLSNRYRQWTRIVISLEETTYWWGGNEKFDTIKAIELTISGNHFGNIYLDDIGIAKSHLKPTFTPLGPQLDPYRNLQGFGFKQRRHETLIPENPLVLEYLKAIQDTSSPEKQLLPSMEGNLAQTFNNSLAAICFVLKDEQERAMRILDFYANATQKDNDILIKQNFFYKGEPRGFFQFVNLNTTATTPAYHSPEPADRWMGDMAWLLIAYKQYEHKYKSDRYKKIISLLKNLLVSFYKEIDTNTGYIQHGWRKNDTYLHEASGHHEGNIDAYVALKMCGEVKIANKVKNWLKNNISGKELPLDLYSWRVLALDKQAADLLNIPEFDLRYRKTITVNKQPVVGFFHGPDSETDNIWIDGLGHMACAFISVGKRHRGYFYANQLDKLLIKRHIGTKETLSLPYTVNTTGGYDWVDISKGFTSCAIWYIFAKNSFNPLVLTNPENK